MVAAGVIRELPGGRLQQEQEAEYGSAGAFIPSVTAQRSTGNERLRASNQEPPGHHVTRDTPMGALLVLLLVRPRKVGGDIDRSPVEDRREESAPKRTWRLHVLSTTSCTGRTTRRGAQALHESE